MSDVARWTVAIGQDADGYLVKFEDYAEAISDLNKLRERLSELERQKQAGVMLANCAFNLSQRNAGSPLTESDIRALKESQLTWDAAIDGERDK